MKISKRYPIDPSTNDIDRAWLVDQLPRAKRPNALLVVALSPLPIVRIAAQTWVTPDTLIDFVLGDDDMTSAEMDYLGITLDVLNECGPISHEWLLSETLCTETDEDMISAARNALQRMPVTDPVTPLVLRLMQTAPIPHPVVDAALLYDDMANMHIVIEPTAKPRSKRITRRRRRAA